MLITDNYFPRPATKSMFVYMRNVQCSGEELTLLDCSYSRNYSNDHSNDVGIKCRKGEVSLQPFSDHQDIIARRNISLTASCDDGDLRLVGGETEYEGLLQVCFSQRWGTVNGDGWSASDAQVACRQLGFDTVGKCFTLPITSVKIKQLNEWRCRSALCKT